MSARTLLATLMIALVAVMTGCASASPPTAVGDGQVAPLRETARATPRATVQPGAQGGKVGGPAFAYAYLPPVSPELDAIHRRVLDADLWRQVPELQAIDGMFALPRPLRYVTAECGEFGAFYHPGEAEVVLCYETLRTLYEHGQAHQRELGLGEDHSLHYVRANVRFIVLHETGHALVDLLDLPVTGRQEDAVDQLAAILMLRFAGLDESPDEVAGNLRLAANWMLSDSTGAYDLDAYADEHALGEQRFFNLQCLVYGTDPDAYAGMVAAGELTAARAAGCARETRGASRAWVRLLVPYLAPGYEAYGVEAARFLERRS
jgi:hypothetical protein